MIRLLDCKNIRFTFSPLSYIVSEVWGNSKQFMRSIVNWTSFEGKTRKARNVLIKAETYGEDRNNLFYFVNIFN